MPRVKTFTSDLKIFKTANQLEELDNKVNEFIGQHKIQKIHSVSDTTATDDSGTTIGIVRVVAYD